MNDKHFLPPEDRQLAEQLEALAERLKPGADFERELENRLMNSYSPEPKKGFFARALPALSLAAGLILLAVILNWSIRTLLPNPPQPAAGGTPAPTLGILLPGDTPTPSGETYDWRGTPLTLQINLPDGPSQAFVYNYLPEQPATRESARALAAQLGMNGAVYDAGREFLVVDGNQWLYVRSDQYFQYYPDYPRYTASINGGKPPADAEARIEAFIQARGFNFPHKILPSEIYGGYVAAPLTPDGNILCYEYFKCAGLHFQLDEQGILYVDGILPKYEPLGQYAIISAEEAFQKILNASGEAGMLEGMQTFSPPIQTWVRTYPLDQTLTYYGLLTTIPSAEGGAPLVALDGYTVTGNLSGIPSEETYVQATGQFHTQNGLKTFALETWQPYDINQEEGLLGAINQQGDQVILNTIDDEIFILPDGSDLPLPLDNVFVIGVRVGEIFEWKSIDLRNVQGGGGGGGGGLGFYKLNLTGTPVPFSTPETAPQFGGGGGGGNGGQTYTVQAGDTLSKIADQFGVTVEALVQANGLGDPSTLQVGQTLVIPVPDSFIPQKVEGLRGVVNITIYKQADGSQHAEYVLWNKDTPFPSLPLTGENLDALQAWQNRPVDIWGTIEDEKTKEGAPTLKVERYEIPFPDLKFQILRGTQTPIIFNGQPVTLFTAADGQTYAQLSADGLYPDSSTVGNLDDVVQIEALIIPGETFGSYPALRMFSAAATGEGVPELTVTADQINVVDLTGGGEYAPPTATIERVELVYYIPDPRYLQGALSPDQRYIQPAWLFSGHYSDGTAFFVLVQALKQEFLLPEIAPYTQPG